MLLPTALLWIAAIVMQLSSPTQKDLRHTIPFNNHGTTHYLSWPVYYLPWVTLSAGVISLLLYWILCRRIAQRSGESVDAVMGIAKDRRRNT